MNHLKVHTRHEQIIWTESTRLICNIIIYYNSFVLSELLEKYSLENNRKGIELIKNVSPIAWQHINLHGHYLFNEVQQIIDFEQIIKHIKIK